MAGTRYIARGLLGLTRWWRGREFRLLLGGLPALGIALAVTGVALAVAATPTQEVEARYRVQAESAFQSKDYPLALTCYDRLGYRAAGEPELLYGLALSAEAVGQTDRAHALMAQLAPSDAQGHGPAHIWQARQILRAPGLPVEARKVAESHLLHALADEIPDSTLAHGLLCELFLMDGEFEQAEAHLVKAVKARPHLRLRAAQLHLRRGDTQRARVEAELAVNYFRGRAKADVTDHASRLGWADATTFLERFPEAVAILEEGYAATQEQLYRVAAARVHTAWYDTLARDTTVEPGKRLNVLEKGLKQDPGSMPLLERLLAATRLQGGQGDQARASLHALLADGKAPATVHFALGLDALQQGKEEQARLHWERAIELAPDLAVVANNLAWMLASAKEPDLSRALHLVNLALARTPNALNFRHTRGVVLFKMGRWKDALADLEAALPRYPDSAELHHQLAEVYARLDVPAMAAEHRRQAELKAARKPAG